MKIILSLATALVMSQVVMGASTNLRSEPQDHQHQRKLQMGGFKDWICGDGGGDNMGGGMTEPCDCECEGGGLGGLGGLGMDLPIGGGDLDMTFVGVIYDMTGTPLCVPKMLSGLASTVGFSCATGDACNKPATSEP